MVLHCSQTAVRQQWKNVWKTIASCNLSVLLASFLGLSNSPGLQKPPPDFGVAEVSDPQVF